MRLRLAVLALAILPVGLALAQEPKPRAPDQFSEELEVREIGVVVEMPESYALLRQLLIDPADVLVTVDGVLRPATRLSGETPADWTVAIYVDEVLAPSETVALALLALAKRSERLAGLGAVEVTVADPGPHPELAPNREALRIRQALSDLSGRARLRRTEKASPPDAAILRRQCDRLIAWASAPRPPGPRVLFLVADGFPVSPEEQKSLGAGGAAAAAGRAAILHETARMLAAYGWITVPLPLRETRESETMAPAQADPEIDRFRVNHSGGSSKYPGGPPAPTQFRRRTPSPFRWDAAVALQIDPGLSPLRALVAPTGALAALVPGS